MARVLRRTNFALAALLSLPLAVCAGEKQRASDVRPDSHLFGGVALRQWKQRLVDFDAQSPTAAKAVAPLLEILGDDRVDDVTRRNAALALGNIGEPARGATGQLARMIAAGNQDRGKEALWAAKALSLMGPAARDATPALVAVVGGREQPLALRQLALESLARIGGAHPDAVAALVATARLDPADAHNAHEHLQLRALAVEAIGVAGADAAVAGPILVRIVRDPRAPEVLRRGAAVSLGRIGEQAAIAAAPLAELLVFDPSEAVRDAAATSLAAQGREGRALLMRFLRHEDAAVRWRAAKALGGATDANIAVKDALTAALRDSDERVRLHAVGSLVGLQDAPRHTIPAIVDLLKSQRRTVRVAALELLASLGDDAQAALPQLERLRRHERAEVRRIAELGIRRIQGIRPD